MKYKTLKIVLIVVLALMIISTIYYRYIFTIINIPEVMAQPYAVAILRNTPNTIVTFKPNEKAYHRVVYTHPITFSVLYDNKGQAYFIHVDEDTMAKLGVRYPIKGNNWIDRFGFPFFKKPDVHTNVSVEWQSINGFNIIIKRSDKDGADDDLDVALSVTRN